jgi:hypothetical protein
MSLLQDNPSRSDRDESVSAAASVAIVFGFVVSDNPSRADQRRRVVVSLQGGCLGGQAVVGAAMLYNCAVFDKA